MYVQLFGIAMIKKVMSRFFALIFVGFLLMSCQAGEVGVLPDKEPDIPVNTVDYTKCLPAKLEKGMIFKFSGGALGSYMVEGLSNAEKGIDYGYFSVGFFDGGVTYRHFVYVVQDCEAGLYFVEEPWNGRDDDIGARAVKLVILYKGGVYKRYKNDRFPVETNLIEGEGNFVITR